MLALLAAGLAAACAPGPGEQPDEVLNVVERAARMWNEENFDGMVACYTGRRAGHYREEFATVYGGDGERFFASKRRMVVVGPVSLRRRAFATVRVMILASTGYKPFEQVSVVFADGEWKIDSLLPGDVQRPRVDRASAAGIIGVLRDAAEAPATGAGDSAFAHIQTMRAIEVVADRRIRPAARPLATLLAHDPDPAIRQFAAATLGRLADPATVPELVAALADEDLRVRGDAAAALGRLGAVSARDAISTLAAGDPDAWVRDQATAALAKLGGASGSPDV